MLSIVHVMMNCKLSMVAAKANANAEHEVATATEVMQCHTPTLNMCDAHCKVARYLNQSVLALFCCH